MNPEIVSFQYATGMSSPAIPDSTSLCLQNSNEDVSVSILSDFGQH